MQLEVLFNAVMAVPRVLSAGRAAAGIELDETHATFDEAPRDQALFAERCGAERECMPAWLRLVDAVGFDRARIFLREIQRFGRSGLQPEGQLVAGDAG